MTHSLPLQAKLHKQCPSYGASSSDIIRVKARVCLFREGDVASHVYEIVRGRLFTSSSLSEGRRQIYDVLGDGAFAGLTRRPVHAYAATTLSECLVRRLDRIDRITDPSLQARMSQYMFDRLDESYRHAALLGHATATERVAAFLLAASLPDRTTGAPPIARLTLTMTEASDYLGLSLETVSRQFTKLKKSGIIAAQRAGTYELRDRAALERMAFGHAGSEKAIAAAAAASLKRVCPGSGAPLLQAS